jgi:hypothetical protein
VVIVDRGVLPHERAGLGHRALARIQLDLDELQFLALDLEVDVVGDAVPDRGGCGPPQVRHRQASWTRTRSVAEAPAYIFKPHERPTLPGSPANPDHPARRRQAYFAIGCLIGITGGLGNALVTVNLVFAQGTLALNSDQAAWLTAAYFMTNVTGNLLLVKYRQQYGLQPFIRYMLAAYALTTIMHLFLHGFWTSVAVRAASGIAASGLSTLTVLYFMQSMPAPKRLVGGHDRHQHPAARHPARAHAVPADLLDWGDWHISTGSNSGWRWRRWRR